MTIRLTGMNSGLDTDAIIQELVSAYRAKGDKIKKQQTRLSWTQDKWKSINAKVLNLYKSLDYSFEGCGKWYAYAENKDACKRRIFIECTAETGQKRFDKAF